MTNNKQITQGREILKMIDGLRKYTEEEILRDHAGTLDEIELKFWIYIFKLNPIGYDTGFSSLTQWDKEEIEQSYCIDYHVATSLDACKSAQDRLLKGWVFYCDYLNKELTEFRYAGWSEKATVISCRLPTINLAWLHAIIQAYIWEIENAER